MKFPRQAAATKSILVGLLLFFCATTTAPAEGTDAARKPTLVLHIISGGVLIGLSHSIDGAYHFWTYDLASGTFEVRASGFDETSGYPNLIPGVTPSRLIWNDAKYTEDGLVDRFESIMVEPGSGGPVTMDFIRTDPMVNTSAMVVTSLGLFSGGKHLLVLEGDSPSKYWWWNLSTKESPTSIAAPRNSFPMWNAPATGIAPTYIAMGEIVSSWWSGQSFRLALLDTAPLRQISALTTELRVIALFDGAPSASVVAVLQNSKSEQGLIRLSRADFEKGGEIDPATCSWLSSPAEWHLDWAADIAFWIHEGSDDQGFALNMARYTEADRSLTVENSIPIARPAANPDYVVSSDAKMLVTCDGTNIFEVRKLAYPKAELTIRCRIEESRVGDKVVLNLRKL